MQVFNCYRVVVGESSLGPYSESGFIVADGFLEVLGAVAGGEFGVGGAEVVLGHGPVGGEVIFGVDRESGLIALDGLLKVVPPVAGGEFLVADAEVVLGHGPFLGESRLW